MKFLVNFYIKLMMKYCNDSVKTFVDFRKMGSVELDYKVSSKQRNEVNYEQKEFQK